jgi:2-polyprenyl-3-methyl-5-hydroxy-6-metoxy-1,4-benzoquinol methylase
MTSPLHYDYEFDVDAINNTASAIYRVAKAGGSRVLDIGSGPAVVSSRLARDLGFTVTCIDMDDEALAAARERGVAETFSHDLGSDAWIADVRGRQFDQIILADVLEHLFAPQRLLAAIRDENLLAEGGRLIVSIPNAAHEAVVGSLLADDFRYSNTGILDATHIRWFTQRSMGRLLESEGFTIERVSEITRTLEQTFNASVRMDLDPEVRTLIRQRAPQTAVYQYVFTVAPISRADATSIVDQDDIETRANELAELFLRDYRPKLDAARTELEREKARVRELRTLITETRAHALREMQRSADEQERLQKSYSAEVRRGRQSAATIRTLRARLGETPSGSLPAGRSPWARGRRAAGRVVRRVRNVLRRLFA